MAEHPFPALGGRLGHLCSARLCIDCSQPLSAKLTTVRCRSCYDAQRPLKATLPPGFAPCTGCGLRVLLPLTECSVCLEEANPETRVE